MCSPQQPKWVTLGKCPVQALGMALHDQDCLGYLWATYVHSECPQGPKHQVGS